MRLDQSVGDVASVGGVGTNPQQAFDILFRVYMTQVMSGSKLSADRKPLSAPVLMEMVGRAAQRTG